MQVAIPKRLADRLGIRPGDEVDWAEDGKGIRLWLVGSKGESKETVATRLEWFDQATNRQERRQVTRTTIENVKDRSWTREDLYDRHRSG